jgi:ribonucleoside-diphosphate reductase alpha chain
MPTIRDSASASALQTLPSQEISTEVLIEKYAKDGETSIEAVNTRVARALAQAEAAEQRNHWEERFAEALRDGFVPAGRIQ